MPLKASSPFNPVILRQSKDIIQRVYENSGYENVHVGVRTVRLGEGRVNVVFDISEKRRAKILEIKFIGNKTFSVGRLKDIINTKESGIFSWLSQRDVYNEQGMEFDKKLLRQFYNNSGFPDFRVFVCKG